MTKKYFLKLFKQIYNFLVPLPVTWLTYEYKNGDLKFEFKIVEGDFDYYDVSILKTCKIFINKFVYNNCFMNGTLILRVV